MKFLMTLPLASICLLSMCSCFLSLNTSQLEVFVYPSSSLLFYDITLSTVHINSCRCVLNALINAILRRLC